MGKTKSLPEDAGTSLAGGAVLAGGAAAALGYVGRKANEPEEAGVGLDVDAGAKDTGQGGAFTSTTRPLSPSEASRFLTQATAGATKSEIAYLGVNSVDAWLTRHFAKSRKQRHFDWIKQTRSNASAGTAAKTDWANSSWRQLISGADQLRQRVGLALLDIMVVGIDGLYLPYPQYAMAAYMDVLLDHAFGNFRDLLRAMTFTSAMGQFLTFLSSSKADRGGSMPDENYARELMQLFTLGLYEMSMDGTLRLDARGQPIETYSQTDVTELARVFTGLRLGSDKLPDGHRLPLKIDPLANETGASTFLGKTVSGGGVQAIYTALDIIFARPNVAPHIARALIQRLVTSNPSPAYIGRVAAAFVNNGTGTRGDMQAVISAILTHPEARGRGALGAPHTGKLRDPVLRLTGWARAFGAKSHNGRWPIGITANSTALNQCPGFAPSVFNFFRPGFTPPNSQLQRHGLVAPELQIVDEQSIVGYLNFMSLMIQSGFTRKGDIVPNYSGLMAVAKDHEKLVAEVNVLLAAGQLSPATLRTIEAAVRSMRAETTTFLRRRVLAAIMITMASSDYLIIQ